LTKKSRIKERKGEPERKVGQDVRGTAIKARANCGVFALAEGEKTLLLGRGVHVKKPKKNRRWETSI